MKFLDLLLAFFLKKSMKHCGKNVRLLPFSCDIKGIQNLSIGDNVSLPNGTTIYCENATVTIGNNVQFGLAPIILTDDSYIPETMKVVRKEDEIVPENNIVIDDDVVIGHNVTILRGVWIGKGARVCSGSVIVSNVKACTIINGAPTL